MPRAVPLPGQGTRRALGVVQQREFPWLNAATEKKLRGATTRADWIDQVARATSYNQRDRDELAECIFKTRLRCYEDRVTTELRRTGVLKPGDRWRLSPDADLRKELLQESHQQIERISATYDRDRTAWAERAKQQRLRQNRYGVAKDFDEWSEGRAAWKAKQIEDTESMLADMRAGDDLYSKSGIANPNRDKAWYWQTTASRAGGLVRKTRARGAGRGRKSGKTKAAEGPCQRCLRVQAGNPYTRKALIQRAQDLGATDPKHFVMHPNERCTVLFKPGGQILRTKVNRAKAEKWASRYGEIERAA